jgi:hypothetical protein
VVAEREEGKESSMIISHLLHLDHVHLKLNPHLHFFKKIILFETNTLISFLLGPSKQRQEMVHNFINELSLSPQDYEIHQAIPFIS